MPASCVHPQARPPIRGLPLRPLRGKDGRQSNRGTFAALPDELLAEVVAAPHWPGLAGSRRLVFGNSAVPRGLPLDAQSRKLKTRGTSGSSSAEADDHRWPLGSSAPSNPQAAVSVSLW